MQITIVQAEIEQAITDFIIVKSMCVKAC